MVKKVSTKIGLICPLIISIILMESPSPAHSNPLTKMQFLQVKKLLEDKVQEEYPSDDKDDYADTLKQALLEKMNSTYYHSGNSKFPVFISHGLGNLGKKVHVLLRGEDYVNPKDRNNFVVLKQTSTPDVYSMHMAHVLDMANIKKSRVIWNDGRLIQQKRIGKFLDLLGNKEVQGRSSRGRRPRCDWIGLFLMCDSKRNFGPLRPRQPRKPLDVMDEAPKKPVGMSEERTELRSGKPKRQLDISSGLDHPSVTNEMTGWAAGDQGDGISEEDRAIVFKEEGIRDSVVEASAPSSISVPENPVVQVVPKEDAKPSLSEVKNDQDLVKKKHKKRHKVKKSKND